MGNSVRDAELWSAVGFVDHVEPAAGEWTEERSWGDASHPHREQNSHSTFWRPGCGLERGLAEFLPLS